MRNQLLGVVTALAMAVAALTITASPASAQSTIPGGDAGASTSGAYGFIWNIQWWSKTYVYFSFLVRDTKADAVHAEGRVQTKTSAGTVTSYAWHKAVGNGAQWSADTHASNSAGVRFIRVEACRVGDALPTVCSWSSWKSNPYY